MICLVSKFNSAVESRPPQRFPIPYLNPIPARQKSRFNSPQLTIIH